MPSTCPLFARRWPLAALLLASLSCSSVPAPGQGLGANWPCRTIPLPFRPDRGKPPVVTALAVQPDHRLLAAAGDDHVIYVLDVASGEERQRLEGHTDWVHTVAYSPDGRVLASAGVDRQVIFWDAATGRKRCVLSGSKGAVTKLAWSHDGQRLAATGFDCHLRIYDVASHQLLRELDGSCPDLRALAFSHSDRLIAAGGRSGRIRVWRTDDFQLQQEYEAHRKRIRALCFSPDDKRLVSAGEDQRLYVQQLSSRRGTALSSGSAKMFSLTFLGPDQLAAGGSDNLIRLWDLKTGRELGRLPGHDGSVAALVCAGGLLVSGSYDTTVRIWTMEDRVAEGPQKTREVK